MKIINGIEKAIADCKEYGAVHEKYVKIGWKVRKDAFAEKHKEELNNYNKAFRYLKKQGVEPNVDMGALKAEYENLKKSYEEQSKELQEIQTDMKSLKEVQFWVDKVLEPEKQMDGKEPEHKVSVREKLKEFEARKNELQQQSEPQQKRKKHDIEH